jgi:glyoxylase-like metal-dependent hydrolase (beta-lactamase superfamily II)
MKIAPGIAMLPLTAGEGRAFNAAVMWDEQDVVLVDTGLPMMQTVIKTALEELGIPFARLNRVIITHHDTDHLGSLPELLNTAHKITVMAHALEKPFIEGNRAFVSKNRKAHPISAPGRKGRTPPGLLKS